MLSQFCRRPAARFESIEKSQEETSVAQVQAKEKRKAGQQHQPATENTWPNTRTDARRRKKGAQRNISALKIRTAGCAMNSEFSVSQDRSLHGVWRTKMACAASGLTCEGTGSGFYSEWATEWAARQRLTTK